MYVCMYVCRRSHACGAELNTLILSSRAIVALTVLANRLLCSLSSPTSDARGVQHLVWPLPLPSGLCLCAFHAESERLSERAARGIPHLVRPTSVSPLGRYARWGVHWSSLLQPLVDSSTTNTPIVSRRLTALTTSTPIFLTPSGYCRRPAPASSCDRHVRIAAYETARHPSGVQQPAAAVLQQRVRYVHVRDVLCSPTHRPPAASKQASQPASAFVAQSPAGVQCGEQAGLRGNHKRCLSTAATAHIILSLRAPK